MSKKCTACNAENDDKAKFCRVCGAALVATTPSIAPPENAQKVCPSCQTHNKLGAKFCLGCGYKFADASAPVSSPLARPQPSGSPPAEPLVVASTVPKVVTQTTQPGPTVVAPTVVIPTTPPSSPQPRTAPAIPATPVVELVAAKPPMRPAPFEKPLVETSDRIRSDPSPAPARESIPSPTVAAPREDPPRHGMKVTLIIAVVVLISLLAGGGYWYFGRPKTSIDGLAAPTAPIKPAVNVAPTLPAAPIQPAADPVKAPDAPESKTKAPLADGDVPNAAQPVPAVIPPADQPPVNLVPLVKPTPNITKAPTKPREVRPKVVAEPIAKTPSSTTESKKSAADLRKQIEDELKGVVRKN